MTHSFAAIVRARSYRSPHAPGQLRIVALLYPLWLAVACIDRPAVNAPAEPAEQGQVTRFLAPDVAARLDASGHFVDAASGPASANRAVLSAAHARQFAEIYAHDFGPGMRPTLEHDRGQSIDFSRLASCGRTFFAESQVDELPAEVSAPTRHMYGPWWLVTLCDPSGAAALSVAVSGFATDLTVSAGHLVFPYHSGSEFFPLGIPRGLGMLPLSPEKAVETIAASTGRIVSAPPRLIAPLPRDAAPQMARWQVALDRPAKARTLNSHRVISRQDYFIGRRRLGEPATIQAPAPEQPSTLDVTWRDVPDSGTHFVPGKTRLHTTAARFKAGAVVAFELVR